MTVNEQFSLPLETPRGGAAPIGGKLKRSFDVITASALIVFFLPALAATWLLISLSSRGSAIYLHERIGLHGKRFYCYKFRTMAHNSAELLNDLLTRDPSALQEWQTSQKLTTDPRITNIGHFLRISSLDELPQLLNVLRGDMSLVGPRPITISETVHYGPHMEQYLLARPGITGLWQVSGRSDVDYKRRVLLDVDYVTNWSMLRDFHILLRTGFVVLSREGSR